MNINHHDKASITMMDSEQRGFGRADHSFYLNIRNCAQVEPEVLEITDKSLNEEDSYVLGYN